MQKIEGDGMDFLHAGGFIMERNLEVSDELRVDTGCLVGFIETVDYEIELIKGIKNMRFVGEGFFFASLVGPGKVWIQTLPFSRLANWVIKNGRHLFGGGKGEGSVLGTLGNILDGDGF